MQGGLGNLYFNMYGRADLNPVKELFKPDIAEVKLVHYTTCIELIGSILIWLLQARTSFRVYLCLEKVINQLEIFMRTSGFFKVILS
jgi:hypothetical protein